jgi:hypothetical protein
MALCSTLSLAGSLLRTNLFGSRFDLANQPRFAFLLFTPGASALLQAFSGVQGSQC